MHFNISIPAFVYQNDMNQLKQARALGQEINSRAWRLMRYFDWRHKLLYVALFAVYHCSVVAILWYVAHLPGDCLRPIAVASAISIVVITVIFGYFMVRFNKIDDPYFCRLENSLTSLCSLGPLFLMITYAVYPEMYFAWFDFRWVPMWSYSAALVVNGLFPVLLTFNSFRAPLERMRLKLMTPEQRQEANTAGTIFALKQGLDIFKAVLDHPALLEAFTQFSVKEWSVENVLFYQAVKEYQDRFEASSQGTLSKAQHIIEDYIRQGAPLEINIDHTVRAPIMEARNNPPANVFDAAQTHIFNLMRDDTFAKWETTLDFKAALEKVATQAESSFSIIDT